MTMHHVQDVDPQEPEGYPGGRYYGGCEYPQMRMVAEFWKKFAKPQ